MQDTIAPTKERIAKGDLVSPVTDQKVNRRYYRQKSKFEQLFNKDQISFEQVQAGLKLERHVIGATGADVRMEDTGPSDVLGIPAQTRHSLSVANVQKIVPPRQWSALMMLIDPSNHREVTLWEIGGALCQRKDKAQASAAALTLIQEGLDVLVDQWGLSTRTKRT